MLQTHWKTQPRLEDRDLILSQAHSRALCLQILVQTIPENLDFMERACIHVTSGRANQTLSGVMCQSGRPLLAGRS